MLSRRASLLFSFLISAGLARHAIAAGVNSSAIPVQPATAVTPEIAVPVDRDTVLNPGDQVTIEIVEDRDVPIVKRVTDTGELDFPYIGRIRVTGKSCAQVIAEAKRQLEAKYYYHATVRLGIDQVNRAATMRKIYLAGLVVTPGPIEIAEGESMTVSEAIVKAGGFQKFADDRKVRVTRKGRGGAVENFDVDVKKILQEGKTDMDVQIQDGDHIYVKQKLVNW